MTWLRAMGWQLIRRWPLVLVFLVAFPFLLLHLLVFLIEISDNPIPDTTKVVLKQPDGTPLVAYEKLLPPGQTPQFTIVFVHGTPATASAFKDQMSGAFPGCDLLVYDRPGFGESPGGDGKTNLPYQTAALLKVLEHVRTPKVILVGHSYGAPVSVEAAAEDPGKIAGVVLIGGCLSPAEEHPLGIQYFGDWPIIRDLIPEPVRATNEELLNLKRDLVQLDTKLQAFSCPLLMLHGTADDQVPVINVSYTEARFQALRKGALFCSKIIPDYNHFMMWEHPTVVNPTILSFIDKYCHVRP